MYKRGEDIEYFLLGVMLGGSKNIFIGGTEATSSVTAHLDSATNTVKLKSISKDNKGEGLISCDKGKKLDT